MYMYMYLHDFHLSQGGSFCTGVYFNYNSLNKSFEDNRASKYMCFTYTLLVEIYIFGLD